MKQIALRWVVSTLFTSSLLIADAQIDTTVWNSTRKVEDNRFVAEIPNDWKNVPLPSASDLSHKFEYTGIGIKTMHLESPVTAFLTIKKSALTEVAAIIEEELKDFNNFSDKVQEPNYKFDTATVKTKTDEAVNYLHTRFYRRSKASNYSRYYAIVQHPKSKEYYVLTFWYQYKDPTYDIERSNKFKEYALKTLSRFSFR